MTVAIYMREEPPRAADELPVRGGASILPRRIKEKAR